MRISFHGAAQEVTGSCHLVDTGQTRFLVDCGIFQGHEYAEKKNYQDFDFDPSLVDFVILTHAHADHCGRLPKLRLDGFRGKIYSTAPTKDFAALILEDSAKLIAEEAAAHRHAPLYQSKVVTDVLEKFVTIPYHAVKKVSADVTIEFYDAGHILGSAFVKVTIKQKNIKKLKHEGKKISKQDGTVTLVFSGDLGNPPVPLLRDTEFLSGADYVVMESTYGGRIHEPVKLRHDMLRDIYTKTIKQNGVLLIPTFALERTQELLYELNHLIEKKEVPLAPVYLDSPLAIKATSVYKKHQAFYDKESKQLLATGDDIFYFPKLRFTKTVRQSKEINKKRGPKIIIAGSGMMNGGRILHHLKEYLGQKKNHLLIIGYQSEGTLGRRLFAGSQSVTIHGRRVKVRAKVSAIGAYSAHADQPKLLHWVKLMTRLKPQKVFLVHGEEKSALMLADGLKQKLGIPAIIPEYGRHYAL